MRKILGRGFSVLLAVMIAVMAGLYIHLATVAIEEERFYQALIADEGGMEK